MTDWFRDKSQFPLGSIINCDRVRKHGGIISAWLLFLAILGVSYSSTTTAASACADGLSCAVITQTSDGFVALRKAQFANSQLVTRLKPYEIIVVSTSECDIDNKWTHVESVPRLDGNWNGNYENRVSGWVRTSLIVFGMCPREVE
jgi:hypothetical protein